MSYRDFYPKTTRHTYHTAASLEIRKSSVSTGSKRYIEGCAVPYDAWTNIGAYMERIAPECFVESLKTDPNIPLLLFHDRQSLPVGIAVKWTHAKDGLYGRWRMDSSEIAQDAARLASQGMLRMSIGFQHTAKGKDSHFRTEGDTLWVTRLRARLVEVSLTPTPAYQGAKVTLAKLG